MLQLPSVLITLLSFSAQLQPSLSDRIKSLYKILVLSKNENLVTTALHFMINDKGEEDFFIALIKELIVSDQFKFDYFGIIDQFFYNIYSDKFWDFIRWIAILLGMKFKERLLEHSIYGHFLADAAECERRIISLAIDNEGYVRWAAHRILFDRGRLQSRLKLQISLLDFDAVSQYKIIVSLLTSYQQPSKTVPLLVSLLNSPYPVVVELLLCKLEELIDAYKLEVIELLQDEVSEDLLIKKEVLTRLNQHLQLLAKKLSQQKAIKELNPTLNQSALMRDYIEAYSKSFQRSARKARERHKGIISLATQIQVARGGGFHTPGREDITPLRSVSASFSMPRTIWIQPEKMDFYRIEHFTENWKDTYSKWEALISSSGNI